ncbi:MAG: tRNA uracil 4-sulfurtransferase ThiI [Candidatus Rokuibacteriota bacterium]
MARLGRVAIVHYAEISLKGGNRPLFLRQLRQNVERALADLGPAVVRRLPGRLIVDLEAHPDPAAVRDRIVQVCGVASVCLGLRADSSLEAMKEAVACLVGGREFSSFRITARRAFKTYPRTSVELNRELGAFVLERVRTRVDLRDPALNIHVEVLPAEAFVCADRLPGPGGLPVGASGLVTALLSGGIDSPVAAWRMIKRGCRVMFVHFHSVPYLPTTSQDKARALVERLTQWQYESCLCLIPFGEIQREVVLSVPPPLRVVVYRRLMVRIAEALGRQAGAQALVSGESLGQVASQTLANIARIDEAAAMPILRPLVGTDKLEIVAEAKRLDTYEISIEPDLDCCTLFTPKHPATAVRGAELVRAEERLDIPRLVTLGCNGVVREHFAFPARPETLPPT